MGLICVKCGKIIPASEVKGSAQHPYCAECFEKDWHNDEQAYMNWLVIHDFVVRQD